MKPDVIVAGDLFIDLVMTGFSALPGLGEEGFASACSRETGGGTAHTSCGLARLGRKVAIFGAVGAADAAWMCRTFQARGVDADMLVEHPSEPTGLTVAVSTPADRIFYTYYGANGGFLELLGRPETWRRLGAARHVHLAYPVPGDLLAEMACALHEAGATVSIDVGWHPEWLESQASVRALAQVDWFLPNEREAQRMSGESSVELMLEWFAGRGVHGVALKLGSLGSAALVRDAVRRAPALPVRVFDTTGAGDCFNAGFLHGLLAGMGVEDALRYGNICGALSTEMAGGIAGFPTSQRVRDLWEAAA